MVTVALSTAASTAVAHGDACQAGLWSLAVESAALPDGWAYRDVEPVVQGWWALELDGPDGETVSAMLGCVAARGEFGAAVDRTRDLRGGRALAVAQIGDRTWATRNTVEYATSLDTVSFDIMWTRGDVLGVVREYAEVGSEADWTDLEDIALALDGLLAQREPATIASDSSQDLAVVVRDLQGMTVAQAQSAAAEDGLALRIVTLETDGLTPGVVLDQAPAPNDLAEPGDAIHVTVAVPLPATPAPEPTLLPEFAKKAAHTSEDDPDATYGLVSGRYRLAWDTPPDDSEDACERVEVAVVQQDGDFEYVRGSTSARFNATVNDLPQGIYKLEQRAPDCTTWQLRIDWMTK